MVIPSLPSARDISTDSQIDTKSSSWTTRSTGPDAVEAVASSIPIMSARTSWRSLTRPVLIALPGTDIPGAGSLDYNLPPGRTAECIDLRWVAADWRLVSGHGSRGAMGCRADAPRRGTVDGDLLSRAGAVAGRRSRVEVHVSSYDLCRQWRHDHHSRADGSNWAPHCGAQGRPRANGMDGPRGG